MSWSIVRRLAPWAVVLLVGVLLIGILPAAQAQNGSSAADALPIGTDGKFSGTTASSTSLFYKFNYNGNNQTSTITVTFEPPDSNRLDIFILTGDASNPHQESVQSTLSGNVRTIQFQDPGSARVVYVKVENDHPDRSVSFVGNIQPGNSIATPTPTNSSNPGTPQSTPTAGPVATTASQAITLIDSGQFSGTLNTRQAVWYRFFYGNPGADATVSISIAPSADSTDLNIYTSSDATNLGSPQGGDQVRNGNTISRHVNLPNAQFVFFSLGNNNDAQVVAYGGSISPFVTPPATMTPTPAASATPAATSTPVVQPAPSVPHDAQYYGQTGFRVDNQVLQYFQSKGALETFGFPISRMFTFLGCPVQMFQRLIIQQCPGAPTALINTLDPEIFPYTRVNGSVFPGPDDQMKASTPPVSDPDYAPKMTTFINQNVVDTFNGQPVNFLQTFNKSGGLEVLGAPISHPTPDPTNSSFIYQRFQRVILHYRAGISTEALLLADYLKQIMLGPGAPNLPQDLAQQAQNSKFFQQYCRGQTRWLCRPNDLPSTDLTFAFEQG
jgi:hypothetical protein